MIVRPATRRRGRRPGARGRVVVALALVVAACGGAGADDPAANDAATTTTTVAADPAVSGGGVAPEACDQPTSTVDFDPATGLGAVPVWSFTDLADPGAVVCTTDWEGTPTVVNFWATWCGFCVEEMPDLQAASEALAGRVRVVGIDVQDNRDDALAFLDETGVTYDSVADPRQQDGFYGALGNRGMPTTLFVDARGTIVHRHTGPLTEEQALALVEEHLDVAA